MPDLIRAVRVRIRHSDPLIAAGLAASLADQFPIEIESAFGAALQPAADVFVCDYDTGLAWLSDPSGCRDAAGANPPAVLIVSWRDSEAEIRDALQAGARGYLLCSCALSELVRAVQTVGRGAHHLCDTAARLVAQSLTRTPLTRRETQVLHLMACGLPNKTIASRLDIAVGTVKAHAKSILAKLEASSRTEATVIAERRGLLGPRLGLHLASVQAVAGRTAPLRPFDAIAA